MASACMFIPSIHIVPFDQGSGHAEQGRGVQADAGRMEQIEMRETMYFRKLVQWIREEFEAAPGLRLNVREAAAFLGLDLATCERVLVQLVCAGFLAQGPDGRFGVVSATM
jgi:hypothetical protein